METTTTTTTSSTREEAHIALDKFRALTESLIEGIQESLQASRPQRRNHNNHNQQQEEQQQQQPAVTLVKEFSPAIKVLTEYEKSIRDLIARARRQEQLQLQTDRVKDAVVRNEERLVAAVFFPAHEVDGSLRRAVNKSKFVCGTDAAPSVEEKLGDEKDEKPKSKTCTIDPESLSSYLSSVRFMAPPSMKLFRYNDSDMKNYSVYSSAFVSDEYRDHMATSTNAEGGDEYADKDEYDEDML